MSFKKDYKLLWEATKLDLNDQVAYSAGLADEIKSLEDQLTSLKSGDTVNLRERIAMMVASQGWFQSTAKDIFDWITDQKPAVVDKPKPMIKGKRGPKKGIKRGPYKKAMLDASNPMPRRKRYMPPQMLKAIGVRGKAAKDILAGKNPKTGKRAYTKKSKFWKKKK